jgi:hypothetical protein
MKHLIISLAFVLAGCGGGSEPEPAKMPVQLSADTELPAPFIIAPTPAQPSLVEVGPGNAPFVIGPIGTQVVVGPTPVQPPLVVVGPTVSFVTGPVVGPVAVVTTPIISTTPNTPEPNWCTDGFVIGPCVPRCQPNQFTIGPC